MTTPEISSINLVVPKKLVKPVKNALEAHGQLDKKHKIKLICSEHDFSDIVLEEFFDACVGNYMIPTTIRSCSPYKDVFSLKPSILPPLGLSPYESSIHLAITLATPLIPDKGVSYENHQNPLLLALSIWLHSLPPSTLPNPATISALLSTSSCPYTVYRPLILLPPKTFTLPPWPSVLPLLTPHLEAFYLLLCAKSRTTHIALNGPIPLLTQGTSTINILRSPSAMTPLYGDFGSLLPTDHIPSQYDFDKAFWVSTRQNGIFQTWAPRYSMFSRGNIREKARILQLTKDGLGGRKLEASSAIDLYAGIGYFAFSYARAGISRVFCWEINPWSVEGLRRGVEGNGWDVKFIQHNQVEELGKFEERLIVFQETNEKAAGRIKTMRNHNPPVRHVNCGFLPSSEPSWKTAVQVLDPVKGGWIHAHENIAAGDIEGRQVTVTETFKELVKKNDGGDSKRRINCEHVERVKDYAPGVVHCVFDIYIGPM